MPSAMRPLPTADDHQRAVNTRATLPIAQPTRRAASAPAKDIAIYARILTAADTWRCHRLMKATAISWPAIHAQFGGGFKAMKHFKPSFLEALGAATAAYPEARVDVGEAGITLHPAKPPVARLVG